MTARMVPDARPDAGGAVSLLDLLDDAAAGRGTVHFVGAEAEPTTIGALWDASEDAARWMAAHVGAGAGVAMVLTNTRACVTALLGAWRAGCTVASLPLPARGMPPELYLEQLTRFCAAAGAHTLMIDPVHAELVPGAALAVHAFDEVLGGGPAASFGGEPALVQFTSGSVGTPKGIHLTLDAVGAHVLGIIAVLDPDVGDGTCGWLPLSHDMGLIGQLLSPLAAGAARFGHHRLTVMRPETFMANPRSWLRTCAEAGATITVAPNFALELAVRTSARIGALDLSRLRAIIIGSESVQPDTLVRFTDAFAPVGLDPLALCPGYGMAEATLAVTMVRPSEPWRSIPRPVGSAPEAGARPLVSTGRPLAGVDLRVTAADGDAGTIEFRSASQLSRYIGADLVLTDDGYFVTGDIGVMDHGELFVIGRGDEVIVVAGRNVYPADIETTVEHEAIRPGCIAAVAAPDGGLAIVVEPRASGRSEADLESACAKIRTEVARQTGCAPATIAFVPRGSLPKTPSGKLRRLVIRQALAADEGLLARVDFG